VSACSNATSLLFKWSIFVNYVLNSVISGIQDNDPSLLVLRSAILVQGTDYKAIVSVSTNGGHSFDSYASCEFYVDYPDINVVVKDGTNRLVPANQDLVLDASSSTYYRSVSLTFSWKCYCYNVTCYGEELHIDNHLSDTLSGYVTVPASLLYYNASIKVVLTVSAGGKSASEVIYIRASKWNSSLNISSLGDGVTSFASDSKLNISSYISSNVSFLAEWSLDTPSSMSLPTSLTSLLRKFDVSKYSKVVFPYAADIGSFASGKYYTFRLTATELSSSISIHCSITMYCNSAPTSGTITISPTNGTALEDEFTITNAFWLSDNLPLYYVYKYSLAENGVEYFLQGLTQQSHVVTVLPPGYHIRL
jgi:hypothetical protein